MAVKIDTGFLVRILQIIIGVVSPTIRDLLTESVQKLYDKAKETKNNVDDVFVKLLADLLQIDVE